MRKGARLDKNNRKHEAGRTRITRLVLAVLLLLGGCATGTAPGTNEREHAVIGYDASGARTLLLRPVPGARISSIFGLRKDPFSGALRAHHGVDFAAPPGTPVRAAADGIVVSAGPRGSYGHYVRIRHHDRFETAYAHLSGYADHLQRGQRVRQGEVIAYVGSSGRSTGPHLHYEVLADGSPVDPFKIEPSVAQNMKGRALAVLQTVGATLKDVGGTVAATAGGLIGLGEPATASVGGPAR